MAYIDVKKKSDLVNLRKTIQKRFLDEKIGDQNIYKETAKFYKPLIEPLQKIAEKSVEKPPQIIQNVPAIEASPQSQIPAIEQPSASHDNMINLGSFSDKYLKMLTVKEFDHAYGIKPVEGSSTFRLGRKDVRIDGNNLIIDGKHYVGTEGVWKLLTLKDPGQTSPEDMQKI